MAKKEKESYQEILAKSGGSNDLTLETATQDENTNENAFQPESKSSKRKTTAQLAVTGRSNRFYAFRNIDRLNSLRRWRWLFGFLQIASLVTISVGLLAMLFWLIFGVVLMFMFIDSWDTVLNSGMLIIMIGAGIFVASMILRMFIERFYFMAEKRELKKVPEGSEKYLAIMRANLRIDYIRLGLWGAVIVAVIVGAVVGIKNTAVIWTIVGLVIVAFVVGRIVFTREYNKVAQQIYDVKVERRQNKDNNINL